MSTATLSLAEILRETQLAEKAHDVELAEQRARLVSEQEYNNFAHVRDFYVKAQERLTQQIIERQPTSRVGVMVGSDGTRGENRGVYSLLQLHQGEGHATSARSPYYPLWLQFERWAKSQGLRPVWSHRHDGVGMHSWYVLTVTADPSTVRGY